VPGVWIIEPEPRGPESDWCARILDVEELRARGLDVDVVQCNSSFSSRRGTLRGMHYQAEPYGEPKLVCCLRGATFHVALDLRPQSPAYGCWHGTVLSAQSLRTLYLPPGVAHGLQTLVDDCEVFYQMGRRYVPEAARGVRWDDPAFAIQWPPVADGGARLLSERDRSFAYWGIAPTARARRRSSRACSGAG